MINAPHDKEFVFHDGSRARNLLDLAYKIESMSDHAFNHFVNHSKNDFANWIEHVLMDREFASILRDNPYKESTLQLIKNKVVNISSNLSRGGMIGGSLVHLHKVEVPKHEDKVEEKSHTENIVHSGEYSRLNEPKAREIHMLDDATKNNNDNNVHNIHKNESKVEQNNVEQKLSDVSVQKHGKLKEKWKKFFSRKSHDNVPAKSLPSGAFVSSESVSEKKDDFNRDDIKKEQHKQEEYKHIDSKKEEKKKEEIRKEEAKKEEKKAEEIRREEAKREEKRKEELKKEEKKTEELRREEAKKEEKRKQEEKKAEERRENKKHDNKHVDKIVDTKLMDEVDDEDRKENLLWVLLYFSLILLIVVLLVYKLFF